MSRSPGQLLSTAILAAALAGQAVLLGRQQALFLRSLAAGERTILSPSPEIQGSAAWKEISRRALRAPPHALILFIAPEPETEQTRFEYCRSLYALFPRPVERLRPQDLAPGRLAAMPPGSMAILHAIPPGAIPGLEPHAAGEGLHLVPVEDLRSLLWP